MSDLEDMIRDLAKRGEITHLSLAPRSIEKGDKYVRGWGATFAPAGVYGNTFGEDPDPVIALMNAMSDAKLRRKAAFPDAEKTKPARASAPAPASDADLADLLG